MTSTQGPGYPRFAPTSRPNPNVTPAAAAARCALRSPDRGGLEPDTNPSTPRPHPAAQPTAKVVKL